MSADLHIWSLVLESVVQKTLTSRVVIHFEQDSKTLLNICIVFADLFSVINSYHSEQICTQGQCFLNILPNWQPRLGLKDNSRTTDFQLRLFVCFSIRIASSCHLWTYLTYCLTWPQIWPSIFRVLTLDL